jgi:hypothetical protein
MSAEEREAKRDGRGGRHAGGRASDHGRPVRPRVPYRRGLAAGSLVPEAAAAAGLLEASVAAGGHDRMAVRDVRAGLARLLRRRRAVGLHPGRVRPLGRYRAPLGAGAGLRASLQPQPQPLVLGHAAAPARRSRWHATRGDPRPRRPEGARCRAAVVRHRAARRRTGDLRQGLRRTRLPASGVRTLRRHDPAPRPQERARLRPRAGLDPPTNRIDLLHPQGPPRPRRHRARSLHGLRARIATKLLALAAGVWLNHYLNRPTRAFAALAA